MPDGPLFGNGDVGVALAGPPEANQGVIQESVRVQPGAKLEVILPAGPGVIHQFTLRLPGAVARPEVLRSTVLAMTFDGEQTVWCPLGDFFCSADSLQPIHTWQRTVTADGTMLCRWAMPYREAELIPVVPKRGWFLVADEVKRQVAPVNQGPDPIPNK
jgi:hypothetical protein